jgi:hypothetical protein
MASDMKPVFRTLIFWIVLLVLLGACEKQFDEYYKVPDDLIGTILDVLKEDGRYSLFIKAVELAEFDDVLGKTGNFTVFAPDDDAFTAFFNETGYGSLEEIPEEELRGIVFYHIVFWAYSKYMLLYGLNVQDAEIDYSALAFKQPTRYIPPVTKEYDTLGREYDVYHETKFVPVYSSELFNELDLDASPNYEFLYPDSPFTGFHVDRAEVTEYDVPAQNGWIHRINRVLIPPPNHDDLLRPYQRGITAFYGRAHKGLCFHRRGRGFLDQLVPLPLYRYQLLAFSIRKHDHRMGMGPYRIVVGL